MKRRVTAPTPPSQSQSNLANTYAPLRRRRINSLGSVGSNTYGSIVRGKPRPSTCPAKSGGDRQSMVKTLINIFDDTMQRMRSPTEMSIGELQSIGNLANAHILQIKSLLTFDNIQTSVLRQLQTEHSALEIILQNCYQVLGSSLEEKAPADQTHQVFNTHNVPSDQLLQQVQTAVSSFINGNEKSEMIPAKDFHKQRSDGPPEILNPSDDDFELSEDNESDSSPSNEIGNLVFKNQKLVSDIQESVLSLSEIPSATSLEVRHQQLSSQMEALRTQIDSYNTKDVSDGYFNTIIDIIHSVRNSHSSGSGSDGMLHLQCENQSLKAQIKMLNKQPSSPSNTNTTISDVGQRNEAMLRLQSQNESLTSQLEILQQHSTDSTADNLILKNLRESNRLLLDDINMVRTELKSKDIRCREVTAELHIVKLNLEKQVRGSNNEDADQVLKLQMRNQELEDDIEQLKIKINPDRDSLPSVVQQVNPTYPSKPVSYQNSSRTRRRPQHGEQRGKSSIRTTTPSNGNSNSVFIQTEDIETFSSRESEETLPVRYDKALKQIELLQFDYTSINNQFNKLREKTTKEQTSLTEKFNITVSDLKQSQTSQEQSNAQLSQLQIENDNLIQKLSNLNRDEHSEKLTVELQKSQHKLSEVENALEQFLRKGADKPSDNDLQEAQVALNLTMKKLTVMEDQHDELVKKLRKAESNMADDESQEVMQKLKSDYSELKYQFDETSGALHAANRAHVDLTSKYDAVVEKLTSLEDISTDGNDSSLKLQNIINKLHESDADNKILKESNQQISSQLHNTISEKDELQSSQKQLSDDFEILKTDFQQLQETTSGKDNQELISKYESAMKQISEYNQQGLIEENQKLIIELTATGSENDSMLDRIIGLEKHVKCLNDTICNQKSMIATLENDMRYAKSEEAPRLRGELCVMSAKFHALSNQLGDTLSGKIQAGEKLSLLKTQLDHALTVPTELVSSNNTLKSKVVTLEKENRSLVEQLGRYKHRSIELSRYEIKSFEFSEKATKALKELSEQKEQNNKHCDQYKDLLNKFTTKSSEIETTTAKYIKLQEEHKQITDLNKELSMTIEHLRSAEPDNRVLNALSAIEDLRAIQKQTEGELFELKESNAEKIRLKERLSDLTESLNISTAQVEGLKSQTRSIKQLEKEVSRIPSLKEKIDALKFQSEKAEWDKKVNATRYEEETTLLQKQVDETSKESERFRRLLVDNNINYSINN